MHRKVNLEKFCSYKSRAIERCKTMSFAEKSQGLWSNSEIIEYFVRLPLDEPNEHLVLSLKEIMIDLNSKKILCIGGGTGKLGRRIIELYPDSSRDMVDRANILASERHIGDSFISIEADVRSLPFNCGEFDYAIAYGVFRYIDSRDQEQAISEIGRVTNNNFTVAEVILKDMIHVLKYCVISAVCSIQETEVSMFRTSLFYMLFKEYKDNEDFKEIVDKNISDEISHIEMLTLIAGTAEGTLYELKVRNTS